jgi:hypothetical protein
MEDIVTMPKSGYASWCRVFSMAGIWLLVLSRQQAYMQITAVAMFAGFWIAWRKQRKVSAPVSASESVNSRRNWREAGMVAMIIGGSYLFSSSILFLRIVGAIAIAFGFLMLCHESLRITSGIEELNQAGNLRSLRCGALGLKALIVALGLEAIALLSTATVLRFEGKANALSVFWMVHPLLWLISTVFKLKRLNLTILTDLSISLWFLATLGAVAAWRRVAASSEHRLS